MKIKNGKKNYENFSHIEGYLYDASKLALKVTGANSKNPGTEYIGGSIDIATDKDYTNIVTVNFTYELPKFKTGTDNARYPILKDIIDGKLSSVVADNGEPAVLKIDSRISVVEYYTDKDGEKKLVSFKTNESGFIHSITESQLNPDLNKRSTFMVDILANNFTVKEPDVDRGLPMKGILSGYTFDFRGDVMPVSFDITNEDAIGYFESIGMSDKNLFFTKISGTQTNEVVKRQIQSESAWGTSVREVENRNRSWLITWAQKEPYELDTPETITFQEIKDAMANRNTKLSTLSADFDNRKNAKPAASGAFNFDFI